MIDDADVVIIGSAPSGLVAKRIKQNQPTFHYSERLPKTEISMSRVYLYIGDKSLNKVAKNAAWIIGIKIIQAVLALIINMLTARFLGPSNFGLITYAASLVAFVVPIMSLGLNNVLVQEIVEHPEREGEALGTSMVLSAISSLCCIGGVTAFAFVANHNDPVTIMVCFLYSLNLFFQALELMQYWYQAKYLSKYMAMASLAAYLVASFYKVYLLVAAKSVYWFALSNTLDYCLIAAIIGIVYCRLGGQRLSFSPSLGKKLISKSKYYILSSMMVTVFAQTDKIMIKLMIDDAATGYYGVAIACAGMSSFLFCAIIDSFRPAIFQGQKISDEVFESRLTMLYSIVIYLSLAQSIVMTAFAGIIIHILYGAVYAPAVKALQIVVWYTTFSYMGSVRNIWILANGKQSCLWKINMSGAIVNIVMNEVLIPVWGICGAAAASLLTQFFTNVIVSYVMEAIRPNNRIMFRGADPQYFFETLKKMWVHKK